MGDDTNADNTVNGTLEDDEKSRDALAGEISETWGYFIARALPLSDHVLPYATDGRIHERYEKTAQSCADYLKADLRVLAGIKDILTGNLSETGPAEFGLKISQIFASWREESVRPPSLPALIAFALSAFGHKPNDKDHFYAFVAGILGEIGWENPYHNTHHFREVMALLIRLCAVMKDREPIAMGSHSFPRVLAAAAIHDLGHNGGTNHIDDMHMPFKIEQQSFEYARPFLQAAGADGLDIERVRTMILAGDTSSGPAHRAACHMLRDIYLYLNGKVEDRPDIPKELQLLIKDRHICTQALLLHEADIGVSAGLSRDMFVRNTQKLAEEYGRKLEIGDIRHFLEDTCMGGFASYAGKTLLDPNYAVIREAFVRGA